MLPFAVVFVLAAFNRGGGEGVAPDIQELSVQLAPRLRRATPPPSHPAHIVFSPAGNSVWGFSEGSSRGGRSQLSFPLSLFIIVLIVVYDID